MVPENIHTYPRRVTEIPRGGGGGLKVGIFRRGGGKQRVFFPECFKFDQMNKRLLTHFLNQLK